MKDNYTGMVLAAIMPICRPLRVLLT